MNEPEKQEKQEERQQKQVHFADALIWGAGPAGISCALELKDAKVDHIVIDRNKRIGGQLNDITSPIGNFAGGNFANGECLSKKLAETTERAGIKVHFNQDVLSVDLSRKELLTRDGLFRGNALFIATGYRPRRLCARGLDENGHFVAYRTGLIEAELINKDLVIIGGGDTALLEALGLCHKAKSVTVVNRSDAFKARPDVQHSVEEEKRISLLTNFVVSELTVKGNRAEVHLVSPLNGNTRILPLDKLIVRIGYAPNTELLGSQLALSASGHVLIGGDCATSVAGVFAGGDIAVPGYDRIASAMGQGSLAAGSICRYLWDRPARA